MAGKKQGETSNRSNKIRFVLVEADISDGNLSELTQAITSALKSSAAPVRQIARPVTQALPPAPTEVQDTEQDEVEEVEAEEPQNGDEPEESVKPKKKFKAPDYLPDLFAGEKGKAFKEFAAEKAPSNKSKKYLAATYWLKEHGDSATVNANRITLPLRQRVGPPALMTGTRPSTILYFRNICVRKGRANLQSIL